MASKNRPAAAQDKSRERSKGSKDKTPGSPKAEITVTLTQGQASRFLKNAKVITAQELARQTGVKVSAANKFLQESLRTGSLKRVGGYSGHWLYQPVSS